MKIKDFLENKKVIFYGDSITHNWLKYTHDLDKVANYDGKSMSGYAGIILKETKATKIDNFAVSGGCYADTSSFTERQVFRHFPYQIDNSISKLSDADVIFIFFGTNDYSSQTPFGRYDELLPAKDSHTFYSGMNYGFNKIKEINPKAKVFVLTLLNRTCPIDVETFNYSLNEYNLAIKHNAKRFGFQIIDISSLFKLEANFPNGKGPIYSDDGLHPNELGHKVLAEFILNSEVK